MAVLRISEYAALEGALVEPSIKTQIVEVSAESQIGGTFSARAAFVRLDADTPCAIAFGMEPEATLDCMRLRPGHPEIFALASASYRIAVISAANSSADGSSDAVAWMRVISDPKAAKTRLAELTAKHEIAEVRRAEGDKALAEAKRLATQNAQRTAALDERESRMGNIESAEAKLGERAKELEVLAAELNAKASGLAGRETQHAAGLVATAIAEAKRKADFEEHATKVSGDLEAAGHRQASAAEEMAAREAAVKIREENAARSSAEIAQKQAEMDRRETALSAGEQAHITRVERLKTIMS